MALRTVAFAFYIIGSVFITEVESVHCAVRCESLYNTDKSRRLTFRNPASYI
jgi:hypothetical protein